MDLLNKDIRWKQRFHNFEKAFLLLERTIQIENLSEVERGCLIQFFEMAFELAWKLMQDYLEVEGFIIKSPRGAIKQAFQSDIISDGHVWLEALETRNLTTHTYEKDAAIEVEGKIRQRYFPALKNLYIYFKNIGQE